MTQDSTEREVVAGRYRLLRPLGTGAHGVVDLAEDLLRGDRRVALKRIEGIFGGGEPDAAAERLRWFLHPRWAEILDEGRYGDHGRFQVSRFVDGESLDKREGPQPVEDVWRFLEDGARILRAFHAVGLIHYDVTPGNWLRQETPSGPTFTLTDGGLAHAGPVKGIARGTPLYMAPELTENRAHDHRVDLYSLGLVAWRMATGRVPWEGGAGEVLGGRRREKCPSAREFRPDLPAELDEAIALLLAREPAQRPLDAAAYIARLAEYRRREIPVLRPDEIVAAASGGPLVGRDEAIARFRRSCRLIAATQSVPSATASLMAAARHGPDSVLDPVLLVHGPAGSGGTRLVREFAALARSEDLACVLLPGREGRADRRSPLRRLSDALVALTATTSDPIQPTPPARRGAASDPVEGDGSAQAIERFVSLCEAVATRLPLALVVEDFADLPAGTQEALRVLCRQLVSRAEHPGGRAPLRFLLVVDHGPGEPTEMLVPDAADPRKPLLPLGALADADLRTLTTSRFPGAEIAETDLPAVRSLTDGLPGPLVALLAEALRRGDLRPDASGWHFDTSHVAEYRLDRALPADLHCALDAASPALRTLTEHLALLEEPLPETLCARLVPEGTLAPGTPLLVSGPVSAAIHACTLASRALRDRIRGSLSPEDLAARRDTLIDLLVDAPSGPLLLERARLLAERGSHAEALEQAVRGAPSAASTTARLKAQSIALAAVRADPSLLSTPDRRLAVAGLLHVGPEGIALSDLLTAALPDSDLPTARRIVEFLFGARRYEQAERLARASLGVHRGACSAESLVSLEVLLLRTRLALQPGALARESFSRAAHAIRSLALQERRDSGSLVAAYLLASAQVFHRDGLFGRAFAASRAALRYATRVADQRTIAQAINNLGVSAWQLGSRRRSQMLMRRAFTAKLRAGDLAGALGSSRNLAILLTEDRRPLEAAALHLNVVGVSTRHALPDLTARALNQLALIHDQQGNPERAQEALQRALALARSSRLPVQEAAYARRLAISLAALGQGAQARCHLLTSALCARRLRGREVAAHFVAAIHVDLHLGHRIRPKHLLLAAGSQGDARPYVDLLSAVAGISELRTPSPFAGPRFRPRSPAHRAHQLVLLFHRVARGEPEALRFAPALLTGEGTSPDLSLPAAERRLVLEAALRACRRIGGGKGAAVILESLLKSTDVKVHPGLRGRVGALQFVLRSRPLSPDQWAVADLSSALRDIDPTDAARLLDLPAEFNDCLDLLGTALHPTPGIHPLTQLNALAHRALMTSSALAGPDTRLVTALRKVMGVASRLDTKLGLENLLESLTRSGLEITRAERACLVLLKPDSQLDIRVESSATIASAARLSPAELSHTILRRVLASRTAVLVHDVFDDTELLSQPSVTTLSLRSVLCVPLVRAGTLYGAMYADSRAAAGSFDAVDLEVLSLFAEHAAAAIENSRLLAEAQESYAELKTLQERLLRGERLRVIGELTSGVAHEFNNLLTAILARVQLMELGELPKEVRHHLGQIERAAVDAAEVVRRLQTFAKKQRQGEFKSVDVGSLVTDVVEMLRPLWSQRRLQGRPPVAVRVRTASSLLAKGDPTELREVFTNLLKNALESLEAGGLVNVSAERRDDRIWVEVADTGVGIPPDDLNRLFVPFFTTKGERGTGLGLCMAQQILERHGGEIRIRSTVGKGTTATISIPEGKTPIEQASATSSATHAPCAVLVVDDDPDVLGILCAYLEKCGHRVQGASSGADGLSTALRGPPNVVISDIAMPGMDGIELCKQMREKFPQVPVVLMSGQASAIDPDRIRRAGAAALLAKPFTMRQVAELLGDLAARNQPA